MKTSELEVDGDYMAYCGSLAPVRVLETGLPYAYTHGGRETKVGVRVRALRDVPWGLDVSQARREGRSPKLSHREGEEFVMSARDIERPKGEGDA